MVVVPRSRTTARTGHRLMIGLIAVAMLAACSDRVPGSPDPTIASSGFPVGSFVKDFVEPQFGPSRLAWTFETDGSWAEIPLEGAPIGVPPIRGTYAVSGDVVTLATEYPPDLGTSRHTWRFADGRLWTTYQSSDNPEDAGWFAMLDPIPWIPLE
jgi:hypothetical protein